MLQRQSLPMSLLIAATLLAGCGGGQPDAVSTPVPTETAAAARLDILVATLQPASGSDVTGVVVLTRADDRLILGAAIDGLSTGTHGIHVHETGDCSADDASSAGGHFNPDNMPHAGTEAPSHAGDFGNFTSNAFGQGKFWIEKVADYPLESFEGLAVIVHADRDDLDTQPSGDSGARIACGVLAAQQR